MSRIFLLAVLLPTMLLGQEAAPDSAPGSPATVDAAYIENLIDASENSLTQAAEVFLETWNAAAITCEENRGRLFGNMNADCRKIRSAIKAGEFFGYIGQCLAIWSGALEQIRDSRMLAADYESSKDRLTQVLTAYNTAQRAYCLMEKYQDSNPALFAFLQEAIKAGPPGDSDFANVDLANQIIEGQRIMMDRNLEMERQSRGEFLNRSPGL